MTPKEKAIELVDKFSTYVKEKDFFGDYVERAYAKDCARICVKQAILYHPISTDPSVDELAFWNYWEEVKKEIEEL